MTLCINYLYNINNQVGNHVRNVRYCYKTECLNNLQIISNEIM